ncbi:hypothetical protein [Sulfurimonas sp.]
MNIVSIYPAYKQGMSRSSSDNIGNLTHALKIPRNDAAALCGAKPGKRSNGWIGDSKKKVTCLKCLEKLNAIGKKIEFIYDESLDVGF